MTTRNRMTRRGFLATGAAALLAPTLQGCLGPDEGRDRLGDPLFRSRPGNPTKSPTVGAEPLRLEPDRDGILYTPASYDEATPAPLVVALHAGGGGRTSFNNFFPEAEARGFVMLVPEARQSTWDMVRGPVGVDVAFIDRALAHTFDRCRISPDRIAFLGFSDGASYALSLGISNGELFSHLVGFSPSFYSPTSVRRGQPAIFVSHGTLDTVVPIEDTRDDIVPRLRAEGYNLEFREFEGGHEIPQDIATAALDWFLG